MRDDPRPRQAADETRRESVVAVSLAYGLGLLLIAYDLHQILVGLGGGRLSPYFVVNSDTLYGPALYRDLFVRQTGLEGWALPPSPCVFPDLLLLFPLLAVLRGNVGTALLAAGLVQVGLLVWLCQMLARRAAAGASVWAFPLCAVGLSGFLALGAHGAGTFFLFPLVTTSHFGAFLSALGGLVLALDTLRRRTRPLAPALTLLCLLTSFSDPFFLALFSVPVCAALLLHPLVAAAPGRAPLLLAGQIAFGSLVGLWARGLFASIPNLPRERSLLGGLERLATFSFLPDLSLLGSYMRGGHLHVYVPLLAVFLAAVGLASVRALVARHDRDGREPARLVFLFSLYCGCCFLVLPAAAVLSGLLFLDRYFFPLFLWPFVALAVVGSHLVSLVPARRRAAVVIVSLALASLVSVAGSHDFGHPPLLSVYPERTRQLDRLAELLGIRYGLSDYWNAKRHSLLSRSGLTVLQVGRDLSPLLWNNSRRWYEGEDGCVPVGLVLPRGLSKRAIKEELGPPTAIVEPEGETVYLYHPPRSLRLEPQGTHWTRCE